MRARIRIVGPVALAALFAGACSHDWNAYDPRLGDGGASNGGASAGGSAGSAAGGVSGASGSAGTPSGGGGTLSGGGGTPSGGGGASGVAGATGGGGSAGSGGGTSGGGSGGSGGSGATGGGPSSASYGATVADCTSTQKPDPDLCKANTYDVGMSVDEANSDYNPDQPTVAYLRFDLDNAFAGATVTKVTLTLTTTSVADSSSDSSGEVWAVPCFTRNDLFNAAPAKSGSSPLAGSQGATVPSQTVTWSLPVGSVSAGQPACFGVFPTSTDGVDYYNNDGTTPPSLTIDYQ